MSEIKVDNLTGKTSAGDITVTSEGGAATMQLQQGLLKSFVNYDGRSQVVRGSNNQSSLVDNSSGDITLSFSNVFADANDKIVLGLAQNAVNGGVGSGDNRGGTGAEQATAANVTSSVRFYYFYGANASQDGGRYDYDAQYIAAYGDLA